LLCRRFLWSGGIFLPLAHSLSVMYNVVR